MVKRRLTDLFVVGREISLDDGSGDPVVFWLQKLNLVDQTDCSRRADAARARTLTLRKDKTSEGYLAIVSQAFDIGDHDAMVEFLVGEDLGKIQPQAEAKIAAEDEWSKDNYLQGLQDAWTGGLNDIWAADPTEESTRVKEELDRFVAQVTEAVDDDMHLARERLSALNADELRDQVVDKLVDLVATRAWLEEFYRTQIFYGVRDAERHNFRYFTSREEVDELTFDTYRRLREAYETLEVDVLEGKGSAVAPPSLDSSVPPDASGTADSSGPVAVLG